RVLFRSQPRRPAHTRPGLPGGNAIVHAAAPRAGIVAPVRQRVFVTAVRNPAGSVPTGAAPVPGRAAVAVPGGRAPHRTITGYHAPASAGPPAPRWQPDCGAPAPA